MGDDGRWTRDDVMMDDLVGVIDLASRASGWGW